MGVSSRDGGGAVAGLMGKLKTSMQEDPAIARSMSQNSGFGIEGRDEKMARIREFEASRKGVPIDQAFEVCHRPQIYASPLTFPSQVAFDTNGKHRFCHADF